MLSFLSVFLFKWDKMKHQLRRRFTFVFSLAIDVIWRVLTATCFETSFAVRNYLKVKMPEAKADSAWWSQFNLIHSGDRDG